MANDENEKAMILKELEPLFKKARKEKLLFRCGYQGLLFPPDELAEKHRQGSFIWGAVNWELESPKVELNRLEAAVRFAKNNLLSFEAKLAKWGYDDPRS